MIMQSEAYSFLNTCTNFELDFTSRTRSRCIPQWIQRN